MFCAKGLNEDSWNGEEGCVLSLKVMFTGILVASEGTVHGNPVLVCTEDVPLKSMTPSQVKASFLLQ